MYTIKAVRENGRRIHYIYCGGKLLGKTFKANTKGGRQWGAIYLGGSSYMPLGYYKTCSKSAKRIYAAAIARKLLTPLDMLAGRVNNES